MTVRFNSSIEANKQNLLDYLSQNKEEKTLNNIDFIDFTELLNADISFDEPSRQREVKKEEPQSDCEKVLKNFEQKLHIIRTPKQNIDLEKNYNPDTSIQNYQIAPISKDEEDYFAPQSTTKKEIHLLDQENLNNEDENGLKKIKISKILEEVKITSEFQIINEREKPTNDDKSSSEEIDHKTLLINHNHRVQKHNNHFQETQQPQKTSSYKTGVPHQPHKTLDLNKNTNPENLEVIQQNLEKEVSKTLQKSSISNLISAKASQTSFTIPKVVQSIPISMYNSIYYTGDVSSEFLALKEGMNVFDKTNSQNSNKNPFDHSEESSNQISQFKDIEHKQENNIKALTENRSEKSHNIHQIIQTIKANLNAFSSSYSVSVEHKEYGKIDIKISVDKKNASTRFLSSSKDFIQTMNNNRNLLKEIFQEHGISCEDHNIQFYQVEDV